MTRSSTPHRSLLARFLTLSLLATALLWLGEPLEAQRWDPFPDLQRGSRLALGSQVDPAPFRDTDRCLQSTSTSGAAFYAAVVRVTDPDGSRSAQYSNAVPYVDALYAAWRSQGRLDPDNHMLIAVSLDNRGVAVHPGLRWADMGLEGNRITRIIDDSRFGDWARSGEMGRALCALAEALDEAARQEKDRGRRLVADLGRELQKAADERRSLQNDASAQATSYPALAERWRRQLDRLEQEISDGRRAVERGRLGQGQDALERARGGLQDVAAQLADLEQTHRDLPELDQQLSRRMVGLSGEAGASSPAFARARRQWTECQNQRNAVETALLEGEFASAGTVRSCLRVFDEQIADARADYHRRYVVLPLATVGGFLLLVLALAAAQIYRVRAARRATDAALDAWQLRLDHVADRLLEIESEHPLYFTADHVRWTGESRELDQRCATAVNHVYVLYSEAHMLLDQARAVAGELKPWTLRDLDRVPRLLRETEIQNPGSKDADRLRLPGAAPDVPACRADELLDQLETRCAGLSSDLQEVSRLEEHFYELVQDSDTAAAAAAEATAARAALDSPVDSLDRRLAPLLQRRKQAMDLLDDPIRANSELAAVVADLRSLRADAELGNGSLTNLRGPCAERREELRQRIRTLRDDGFALQEPGLAPDLRLDRSLRQADDIEEAIAEGREHDGAALLDRLQLGLLELDQQLNIVEQTRKQLPGHLRGVREQAAELTGRIPAGRAVLQTLEAEHDPQTFATEADHLRRLDELMQGFEAWCRDLEADYEAQHYLAAAEDLATGAELISQGEALLDDLASIEEDLAVARDGARKTGQELTQLAAELGRHVAEPGVSAELLAETEQALPRVAELRTAMEAERPHWPRLERDTDAALGLLSTLQGEIEVQIEALAQSRRRSAELAVELDELDRAVREELRDRPFVAQGVAAARETFDAWRQRLDEARSGGVGGMALSSQGDQVRSKIAWAADLWRSERDLVHAADAKLIAARDALRREHGRNYGYGVVADCREAERLARQADRHRAAWQWEDVLATAGRVLDAVQQEAGRCRMQAQEAEERERRRREARRLAKERKRMRHQARRRERNARIATDVALTAAEIAMRAAGAAWSSSRTSSSSFGHRGGGFSSRRRSGGSSFRGGSRSGGSSW